ncbi:MAG: glycosyltransferase family 9 protein [Vampirovibrionia bacterium]
MSDLTNKKILIVRLSAIGDTIHGLPVLNAIKRQFPDVHVSWLVEKESSFLLKDNPFVDKLFIFDKTTLKTAGVSFASFKQIKNLIYSLKQERFDIAIDLQGLFKSGLLTALSGAKRKIGFKGTREFAEFFLNERVDAGKIFDHNEHVIEKNLKLAEHLGIEDLSVNYCLPVISEDIKTRINNILCFNDSTKKTVVIIPATTWQTKFWPKEHWQNLLKYLEHKVNIVITGTNTDISYIEDITKPLSEGSYLNIAGKTSLLDLIELFYRTDIVIGVDTGPLHLAVASEKPEVLAILGPTSAKRNGALGHKNIHLSLDCQPCHKKKCPLNESEQIKCMNNIDPAQIIDIIEPLLK